MVGHKTVALLAATLVAFVVPSSLANHPQTAHGDVLVFDHKTGNEWWVEVVLTGGASGSVSGVQAMDTGGAWVALSKQSWGAWAASFHIEPGHQVKFRASWVGGDTVDSCWFTHPAGVEQCGSTTTSTTTTSSSTTTTSGGAFDATFSGVKGNNWWVQASVSANQPIQNVDARVNCSEEWRSLTKQSYGWAASFNIPSGSKVDFRATSTSGNSDISGGYIWTAATPTTPCSGSSTTTTTGSAFTATFSNVKGHSWWIQANVAANKPLAGVDARYDCTWWRPLTRESWGWGTSFHIPDGAKVDLRARATDGSTVRSGGYIWPSATPTSGCPDAPNQPPAWTTTVVHDGFPAAGIQDLAVGTVPYWSEGRDLYVGTHSSYHWVDYREGAWHSEYLGDQDVFSMAIGDADRDGAPELYLGGADGHVYVVVDNGPGGLLPISIAQLDEGLAGSWVDTLTIGDADRDGLTELYAVGQDGGVHRIWRASENEWYQSTRIADIGVAGLSTWIADGDRDGDSELYIGGHGGGAYKVEKTSTGWSMTKLMQLCCNNVVRVGGIAAGDGNGDGKTEVYAAVFDGTLRKITWTGTAWVKETIAVFEAPVSDLTLSNVDGVGGAELYVASGQDVWRVQWNGSTWVKTLLGRSAEPYHLESIVAGDADDDGTRELFAGGSEGDVILVEP